jgi:protoporphyrinogen oxidase
MNKYSVIIIGAGPAGLTAAYELVKHNFSPLVFEESDLVGGIACTEIYKGYRFDIGGHRFFTKVSEVDSLWREVLDDKFIKVPRLSRIYYQNKFYDYPLSFSSTLTNLGLIRCGLIF